MPATEARVRGLSLRHWLAAFERRFERAPLDALRHRLPHELASAIEVGLRDDAWYELAWYRALLGAAREYGGGDVAVIEELARMSASAEFRGVHRVLLLFVSPNRLMRIAGRVFARYYSRGCVESIPYGSRAAEVRWTRCVGFDTNLWHDCLVAATVAVEQCGGRDPSWEVLDGAAMRTTPPHSTAGADGGGA